MQKASEILAQLELKKLNPDTLSPEVTALLLLAREQERVAEALESIVKSLELIVKSLKAGRTW